MLIALICVSLVGSADARRPIGGGGVVSYYVAPPPAGNDSNLGTQAAPFATLGQAQTAMRSGPIKTTTIRAGTYVLSAPIALTSADNGETWQSYPGEQAVISGGMAPPNGWTGPDPNGIYQTTGVNWDFRELYVNNLHAMRARTGVFPPSWTNLQGWTHDLHGHASSNTIVSGYNNLTDIEVFSWGNWSLNTCQIASATTTYLTMANPCWNNRYKLYTSGSEPQNAAWLENAYEFLAASGAGCTTGCYYHNRATSVLYYIPRSGETMGTTPVLIPRYQHLFSGNGVSNVTFNRLTFSGTTDLDSMTNGVGYVGLQAGYSCNDAAGGGCPYGTNPTWSALTPIDSPMRFSGGSGNITFNHCLFTHNGGRALFFQLGSHDVTIYASKFVDNGGGSFQWGEVTDAAQATTTLQTRNLLFKDNYLDGPFEWIDAADVFEGFSFNSEYAHNEFAMGGPIPILTGWSPIQIGWGWHLMTPDASYAGNRVFHYNYIHDYCPWADCGAVYTNGPGGSTTSPNTVDSNYFLNGNSNANAGMYQDEGSNYWTWSNNVLDVPPTNYLIINNSSNGMVTNTYTTNGTGTSCATGTCTGNTISTPVTWTHGQTPPAGATAIINNAGIEAGVTPGP